MSLKLLLSLQITWFPSVTNNGLMVSVVIEWIEMHTYFSILALSLYSWAAILLSEEFTGLTKCPQDLLLSCLLLLPRTPTSFFVPWTSLVLASPVACKEASWSFGNRLCQNSAMCPAALVAAATNKSMISFYFGMWSKTVTSSILFLENPVKYMTIWIEKKKMKERD